LVATPAPPDDGNRRLTQLTSLLEVIVKHAEFARVDAPMNDAVHSHLDKILTATELAHRVLEETESQTTESHATELRTPARERVLLVEDDEQVRQLLARTLDRLGYDVVAAENGIDALEQLDEIGTQPDILITDVIMPRLGGRELAIEIRLRCPDVKILFVSGYSHGALDTQALRRPRTGFLQKPFTPRDLNEALSALQTRSSARA